MDNFMWVRIRRNAAGHRGYWAAFASGVAIAALPSLLCPAIAAVLSDWQFDPTTHQLEVTLPDGVKPRYFLLAEPARVVMDLPDVELGPVETQASYSGAVRQIRIGQLEMGMTRIVMELAPGTTLAPQQVELQQLEGAAGSDRWVLRPLILEPASSSVAAAPVPSTAPAVSSASVPAAPQETNPGAADLPEVIASPAPAVTEDLTAEVSGVAIPVSPPAIEAAPQAVASPAPAVTEDLTAEVNGVAIPVSPPAIEGASDVASSPLPAPAGTDLPELPPATFTQSPQAEPQVRVPSLSSVPPNAADSDAALSPEALAAASMAAEDLVVPEVSRSGAPLASPMPYPTVTPDLPAAVLSAPVTGSTMVRVPSLPPAMPADEISAAPAIATSAPETVPVTPPSAVPTVPVASPSSITFGEPLLPGESATAPAQAAVINSTSTSILIPANTVMRLRYPGNQTLMLEPEVPWQEVLLLSEELRDQQTGQVIAPAGTQVIGRFETGRRGSQFITQAMTLQGQNIRLSAESEPIEGDRDLSDDSLLRNSGIGAAAATILTGFTGIGLLAGLAAGAATTYVTAPQPAVIQPNQIIEVRVVEDVPMESFAVGGP